MAVNRSFQRIVIGLMAGTSGDGVDAAVIRICGTGESMHMRLVLHVYRAFPPALRRRLLAAMAPAATRTEEIARLDAELGEAFAAAALLAMKKLPRGHRPDAIGLAGQTVCHLPNGRLGGQPLRGRPQGRTVTMQLGQAARVAERTGVLTVSDFRQSDVAAGGFGAPLVPWTDWVLFRDPKRGRLVQNIGGIANVTWIPPGAKTEDVVAFDTGPGNMIIDGLVARITNGKEGMDRGGRRAAHGEVLEDVLARWMAHPFLRLRPPKTTGREEFGAPFLDREMPRLRKASRSPNDWVATATAFTARSITDAYGRYLPKKLSAHHGLSARLRRGPDRAIPPKGVLGAELWPEVIVCGGGSKNPVLMGMLSENMPAEGLVRPIDDYGIPSGAKEAVSFAMLAAACLDGTPGNLPQVTGARYPAVLGRVNPPLSAGGPRFQQKT